MITTLQILKRAKAAVPALRELTTEDKNRALKAMAESLVKNSARIIEANRVDMEAAREKISDVMLDRLMLNEQRIEAMAKGIADVALLPDPVGRVLSETVRGDGLVIKKVSVPLGVVAIIYESRPNVTSDAAALCFKSGNVCILRGGKEAFRSAYEIAEALRAGLVECGFCPDFINLIEDTTRISATELMTATEYVDLLIPRGGKGLIQACVEQATVPCIETGTGICHIYVDESADIEMALDIVHNAKVSRPSVCNAAEVCLVSSKIAEEFLPKLAERLSGKDGGHAVELRGDEAVCGIIPAVPAGEEDFDTEFLDYILALKIVKDVREAVSHISAHSTHHSDAIVASNAEIQRYFTSHVDSAAVYVNASTRFTDGGEFGLGCEIGISTQKLHARGPMGLQEMTTYKYVVTGNGNIR